MPLQEVEGGNNVEFPQAYAANIFNGGKQSNPPQQPFNHDLSTNKYNPGWRNHLNLRWGNSQQQQSFVPHQSQNTGASKQSFPHPYQQQQQQSSPPPAVVSESSNKEQIKEHREQRQEFITWKIILVS